MNILNGRLWSHESYGLQKRQSVNDIRISRSKTVKTFSELVREIAVISSKNPDLNLLFRGQRREHRDQKIGTSLLPSLFRVDKKNIKGRDRKNIIEGRYDKLQEASEFLLKKYKALGWTGLRDLRTFKELAWAILQHYEVCDTPLLDVTSSLRVACSFALQKTQKRGFIYVIGLPYLNGSISYYTSEKLMNIRLLSICPPMAIRPYFQEGYVVGSFPLDGIESRRINTSDVARRLVAKFRIPTKGFWDKQFPEIPKKALRPDPDEMANVADEIKRLLP